MAWRLLLTRPADDCQALAQTLAEQQITSVCMPLLAIEALMPAPTSPVSLQPYAAVVVVSKPAARLGLAWTQARAIPIPDNLFWFAVGGATAKVLEEAGLAVAHPRQGDDSEALLALPAFSQALQVPSPRVLIMRGSDGRPWLSERLRERGVTVDYLPLYRRCLPDYPAGELSRRVLGERLNGLVVSSGEGLNNLIQLAAEDWPLLNVLPLFVPSPRVAEQAREAGAKRVVDCRGASAMALLAALRSHSPNVVA